jgi:hypothetical protein
LRTREKKNASLAKRYDSLSEGQVNTLSRSKIANGLNIGSKFSSPNTNKKFEPDNTKQIKTLSVDWPIYTVAIEPDGGIHIAAVSKTSEEPNPLWAHCGPRAHNLGFISLLIFALQVTNTL